MCTCTNVLAACTVCLPLRVSLGTRILAAAGCKLSHKGGRLCEAAESKYKHADRLLSLVCELQALRVEAVMKSQHAVALFLCLLQLTALNARVLSQGMSPFYDFTLNSCAMSLLPGACVHMRAALWIAQRSWPTVFLACHVVVCTLSQVVP